ncbi:MAG: DUF309 domain-containing protein [Deltaproteobacteria bacterium]|nr:DUF309 domain-containing protein [Deltaproteobacteria bacterium]MBI3293843.1 DUF309 domain-containing protein [Deltaproteobacteria bacterium]
MEFLGVNETEKFEQACRHFDSAEYFEAHEVWEDLWHMASGTRHAYLQGLIQVAAALHHCQNGNLRGARKLLARSLTYLEKAGAGPHEVDLVVVKDRVLDIELAMQAIDEGKLMELPYFLLPRLK